MIKQVENFYSANKKKEFNDAIEELEEAINEKKKIPEIKILNDKVNRILKDYYQDIKVRERAIQIPQPPPDLDDEKHKKLLLEGEMIAEQKMTFNKNYQNVKINEKKDKKGILILFIVNFFLLAVLLFGCYLVLKETKFDVKDLIKISKRNNMNTNNNSSSLSGL